MSTEKTKTKGLVFELGGAPATPHWIPGVPGLFTPGVPTVIGGPGEITELHAAELHADKSVPLRLVDVPADQVAELRAAAQDAHRANRGGIAAARRTARGLEARHAQDAAEQHTKTSASTKAAS